ncbi:hypothetical protein [Vibrio sp. D431a]|uniref:hypothetical protein n=1 Tax=Vibrio sp. D431a TaxID=2837388 RepID=UPI002556A66B|nr:hypothetical protein [Vibrio sp. D431a]MDK9793811.1 hypothetical protein [Vibrio sp. D431a]
MITQVIPLEILTLSSALFKVSTKQDDAFTCDVKKINLEKSELIISLNKKIESSNLTLNLWCTKGHYSIDLRVKEELRNEKDYLVKIGSIKHLNGAPYTLSEKGCFIVFEDPQLRTDFSPKSTQVMHEIFGYSEGFVVIDTGSTDLSYSVAKSLEEKEKVEIRSTDSTYPYTLLKGNKTEVWGKYLKVNLSEDKSAQFSSKLTPLCRKNATKLIQKG